MTLEELEEIVTLDESVTPGEGSLVEQHVTVGAHELAILRPRDSEALLREEAFEREELLPYWAELWASGLALACVVAEDPPSGRVVELGCGLALPSLAAALGGARVLATDWSEEALRVAARNAERNGIRLETLHSSWADPDGLVERGPFELVLAADVLYEPRDVDLLLELLPRLGTRVLIADPGRPAAARFFERAVASWEASLVAEAGRVEVRLLTQP